MRVSGRIRSGDGQFLAGGRGQSLPSCSSMSEFRPGLERGIAQIFERTVLDVVTLDLDLGMPPAYGWRETPKRPASRHRGRRD
jgi:hypothetical protein